MYTDGPTFPKVPKLNNNSLLRQEYQKFKENKRINIS